MGARSAAGQRTSKTANGRATEYIWSGERLLGERLNNGSWTRYYYDSTGIIGYSVGNVVYTFRKNLQGDITGIYDENGVLFGEYEYDAWGNVLAEKVLVTGMYTPLHNNPIRYRGYYYDLETGLYYLNSRYYDPETGRFLNQDLISYLDPETVNGLNLYSYCGNDPVLYLNDGVSSWSGGIASLSCLVRGGEIGSQGIRSVPEWLKIGVGAISDIILGLRYLRAKGIHKKFVYSSQKFYIFPELGANWHKYKIANYGYGTIVGATLKQIIAGNARASWRAVTKFLGKSALMTGFINFGFNFYENNWQIDGAMLLDTAIDTAIGVGAYCLAAGITSLVVGGLAMAGVAVPGVVVVGGIILLSIGFDWLIREITGYKN